MKVDLSDRKAVIEQLRDGAGCRTQGFWALIPPLDMLTLSRISFFKKKTISSRYQFWNSIFYAAEKAEIGFSLAPSRPLKSHSPPGFVQAPSKLTTLRWWPIWMRIFSSDISALCSLWVAPSAEVKQHRSGASQTDFPLLCSLFCYFSSPSSEKSCWLVAWISYAAGHWWKLDTCMTGLVLLCF